MDSNGSIAQYQSWVCRGMLNFALTFQSMDCIASIQQSKLLISLEVQRDLTLRLYFVAKVQGNSIFPLDACHLLIKCDYDCN